MRKTSKKDESKYRGSINALSMFIHNPNNTHIIPNASTEPIFRGIYIPKDNWVGLQEPLFGRTFIRGGLYLGF